MDAPSSWLEQCRHGERRQGDDQFVRGAAGDGGHRGPERDRPDGVDRHEHHAQRDVGDRAAEDPVDVVQPVAEDRDGKADGETGERREDHDVPRDPGRADAVGQVELVERQEDEQHRRRQRDPLELLALGRGCSPEPKDDADPDRRHDREEQRVDDGRDECQARGCSGDTERVVDLGERRQWPGAQHLDEGQGDHGRHEEADQDPPSAGEQSSVREDQREVHGHHHERWQEQHHPEESCPLGQGRRRGPGQHRVVCVAVREFGGAEQARADQEQPPDRVSSTPHCHHCADRGDDRVHREEGELGRERIGDAAVGCRDHAGRIPRRRERNRQRREPQDADDQRRTWPGGRLRCLHAGSVPDRRSGNVTAHHSVSCQISGSW